MPRSPRQASAAMLALLVLATGCAAQSGDTVASESAPTPDVAPADGPLPPVDTAGLNAEPLLAALYAETGTLLTRGALIERILRDRSTSTGGYGPARTTVVQPHLALYLGLLDEDLADLDRYLDAIAPLTQVFATASFDRWPELESFDICLVPAADSDAAPLPAITLVDVTREGFAAWLEAGGDLTSLLELGAIAGSGVRVQLSDAARAALEARASA